MLKKESIDLVVTSPPYDNLRKYKTFKFDFNEVSLQLFRVLKQGGVVIWIVGDQTQNGDESGSSFRQALRFKEVGFKLYDTMIFAKSNPTPKTHKRYEQCFEYMYVFAKRKPKTTNMIMTECTKAGKQRNGNTYIHDATDNFKPQHTLGKVSEKKICCNIWKYSVGKAELYQNIVKRNHSAKFPILLARDHILSWSNEGDVVLDPFIGSGTTALAAILTGRNYIGFEISEEYHRKCEKYIEILHNKVENGNEEVTRFYEELKLIQYKDFSKNSI